MEVSLVNLNEEYKSLSDKRSRSSSPVKVVEEKLAEISASAVSSEKQEEIVDYEELADIPVDGLTLEAIEKYKKNKPKKVLSAEKERDILALVSELEKSFEVSSR
ncbi:unnamed protein product [Dibothriocephalus latus]|uniref:Uncharacterized protein n=1 Tax=Dibothriocephalus latus TaxID=60516 RepID=A0A3P7Q9B9_DIBLA|nr:unnamed protein product [Dibothriocephalus latus]